ncbi:MAG: ABC transporter permease [Cellulomonas sp.]|uniref:ABC transporter permease n=1 Tax=Cellulomonas sp. TaxID=40001 RepID=UPI0017B58767|nr:ABC transporter permease [Cellulomonas sp.]NMM18155.1 ABC transporter permease [Cellulomonas sp.]NMM31365.1 ABC transporter permease [Cellulomonas sp.]
MSARLTWATAGRVLSQVRHDPRTIAILVLLPCLLLWLISWMFEGTPVLDQFGPLLLGLFPLVVMFIVTSVATLRERTTGTLERLMASPIGKGDVIAGYAVAFGLLAVVQAVVLTSFTVGVLGMSTRGSLGVIMLVAVLDAILGSTLGLAASALARTEFQAVQLMPVVLFPQLITCGLLIPRAAMPSVLEAISRVLPLTYGIDALQRLEVGATFTDVRGDVLVIVGFIALAVVVGSTTLRRRTP